MPLFKVSRHDKLEKKLVKASSMDELVDLAKKKLQLSAGKYKIYLDDYTEIDVDNILMEMAQQAKENLTLIIVPDGIYWNSDAEQSNSSSSKPDNAHAQLCSSPQSQSCVLTQNQPSTSAKIQINHVARIFPKLGSQSQDYLRDKKLMDKKNRKSMISVVVDYMIADLKDFRRGTAQLISEQFYEAYPDSFCIKINGQTLEKGIETLRQQIYDTLNYRKSVSKNPSPSSIEGIDKIESTAKHNEQDEYGCVAYLPDLPSSETTQSQEEKKLSLIELWQSSTDVNDKIINLMNETYYLQRQQLHKDKDLTKIFHDWPYLNNSKIFVNHANKLLDKPSNMIWSECLETLSKPINIYFKNAEIASEYSSRNKKQTEKRKTTDISETNEFVRSTINKAKEYSVILKNDSPFHEIIFKFIAKFMKEDINFLYCFQNEELEDNDLLNQTPVVTPILIIRGNKLHNPQNKYDVVVEKKMIIHTDSFLNGILITFLSYYVFGYVYPKEIEATLEVIQKLFLKINPSGGNKQSGKQRRGTTHSKVLKFLKEIQHYVEK